MPKGEQSGLLTRIATRESVSVRADEKLTAFIQVESAVRAGSELS
jgi:hypothetical protein